MNRNYLSKEEVFNLAQEWLKEATKNFVLDGDTITSNHVDITGFTEAIDDYLTEIEMLNMTILELGNGTDQGEEITIMTRELNFQKSESKRLEEIIHSHSEETQTYKTEIAAAKEMIERRDKDILNLKDKIHWYDAESTNLHKIIRDVVVDRDQAAENHEYRLDEVKKLRKRLEKVADISESHELKLKEIADKHPGELQRDICRYLDDMNEEYYGRVEVDSSKRVHPSIKKHIWGTKDEKPPAEQSQDILTEALETALETTLEHSLKLDLSRTKRSN